MTKKTKIIALNDDQISLILIALDALSCEVSFEESDEKFASLHELEASITNMTGVELK